MTSSPEKKRKAADVSDKKRTPAKKPRKAKRSLSKIESDLDGDDEKPVEPDLADEDTA